MCLGFCSFFCHYGHLARQGCRSRRSAGGDHQGRSSLGGADSGRSHTEDGIAERCEHPARPSGADQQMSASREAMSALDTCASTAGDDVFIINL